MTRKGSIIMGAILALALLLSACATQPAAPAADTSPLVLTVAHANDAHSKLDPTLTKLTMNIDDTLKSKAVYAELGGITRLINAIADVRTQSANTLFLNAGDMFQGSLYFTKFMGEADIDFWNMMKLDAATLGNHEFDKGPKLIRDAILAKAVFPIVAANVDVSAESELPDKAAIKPYVVKKVGDARVGIIGLTTTETPNISSPGKNIAFTDYVKAVDKAVKDLAAQGVNKIILMTHIGYLEDVALAAKLSGVDVIVGGHSHTLLGDFSSIGLSSSGAYPTVVKDKEGNTVLVVQAYQWGNVLGDLVVNFDGKGLVQKWEGTPKVVVGKTLFRIYDLPNQSGALKRVQYNVDASGAVAIAEYANGKYDTAVTNDPNSTTDQYDAYKVVYDKVIASLSSNPAVMMEAENAAAKAKLDVYAKGVRVLEAQIVANAAEDLPRGLNKGPGPLIADSMVWKADAQIGVMNPGGVRINLLQGPLSVAKVYELQPFGNTLVTVSMKGSDVVKVFEDMIDFQIGGKPIDRNNPFVYVSGVRFTLDANKPKGQRVSDVVVVDKKGAESPLDANASYKVVVNNFMAAGGDSNATLGKAAGKYDTGFVDSEAFLDYVQGKTLSTAPDRINLLP